MKYGLVGYSGRMGKLIREVFDEHGHVLVYRCDDKTEEEVERPDVIVDFSLPEAFEKTLKTAQQYDRPVPLVVGTTALNNDDIADLKAVSKKVAVVYARNFSKGIRLMRKIVDGLNEWGSFSANEDWDVEIIEKHHRFKKDKPSGTAKMLAEAFDFNVPTSSIRAGGIPGEHAVLIAGLGELIEIKHQAISPRTFAEGACFAAEKAVDLEPGFYTFDDICKLEEKNG